MCEVCTKENGDLLPIALERFLGEDFGVSFIMQDGWQEIHIMNIKTRDSFVITADGDEGGYFHYRKGK